MSSCKESQCPDIFDPAKLVVAIEETLLSVQKTDVFSTAGQPHIKWNVVWIGVVVNSLTVQ